MITGQKSAVALLMADALRDLGAVIDNEVHCMVQLRAARWEPDVIMDHIDEAREHARAGRGASELFRRAA